MSTLALKYRPLLLKDLIGQEMSVGALTNILTRAKEKGSLHQAYLFAGLRGTGKTSTARIMAKALNCESGPTPHPCGKCPSCLASISPDGHLDIVEIDAASRSSVEDARNLREQVQTLPAFSRYRIYIIDEVHMLSKQAFDALLKMLEEPPSHSIFILATTEIDRVPDTIKSRVQIFPFRLIPVPLIDERLQTISSKEFFQLTPDSSRLIAETADGSMRDALTTLDRIIASTTSSSISEEAVRYQLGVVPKATMLEISDAISRSDTSKLIILIDSLAQLGIDWIVFWKELVINFQDRLHSEIKSNSTPQSILKWARILQILVSRERDIKESSLPRVIIEITLVTLSKLPNLAPLEALLSPSTSQIRPEPSVFKEKDKAPSTVATIVAKPDKGLDDLLKMTGGTIG